MSISFIIIFTFMLLIYYNIKKVACVEQKIICILIKKMAYCFVWTESNIIIITGLLSIK